MTDIGFAVIGTNKVALKFEQFPQDLHSALLERIRSLTARLESMVQSAAPERTGKLRASIVARIADKPTAIRGSVSVNADYAKAGALEYGAHRPAKVRAHEMRLDHVFANRLAAPLTVMVSAHTRRTNIAEHRFLRGSLAAIEGDVIAELQATVAVEAAKE